jgi:hypothetical protein
VDLATSPVNQSINEEDAQIALGIDHGHRVLSLAVGLEQ